MKTYEFDIPGSIVAAHLVITHDDLGNCTDITFGGDILEYDLAYAAMGGEPSEVVGFHRALSEPESEQAHIAAGVVGKRHLSEQSRVALALTITQFRRANVIITTTSYQTIGYGIPFSKPNLGMVMASLGDSPNIRRALGRDSIPNIPFYIFRDAYSKLDWIDQKLLVDGMSGYIYTLEEILELAETSNDEVRMTISRRWLRHNASFSDLSRRHSADIFDMVLEIAKITKNENLRMQIVQDVLVYAGRVLYPYQGHTVGELLLGMSPVIVRKHWWDIARFREVFTDEDQWQMLQAVGRP